MHGGVSNGGEAGLAVWSGVGFAWGAWLVAGGAGSVTGREGLELTGG